MSITIILGHAFDGWASWTVCTPAPELSALTGEPEYRVHAWGMRPDGWDAIAAALDYVRREYPRGTTVTTVDQRTK